MVSSPITWLGGWPADGPSPRPNVEILKLSADLDALPVTLEEVKENLRVDSSDEDETILGLISGMTDFFEARTGWRLSPATYRAEVTGCIPCKLAIERGPLRTLDSISCWNSDTHQWDEIAVANYTPEQRGREFDIYFEDDAFSGFTVSNRPLRIDFSAGFDSPMGGGTSANGLPEPGMIASLKAVIATAYQTKEAGAGAGTWVGEDPSKDYLFRTYRKFW